MIIKYRNPNRKKAAIKKYADDSVEQVKAFYAENEGKQHPMALIALSAGMAVQHAHAVRVMSQQKVDYFDVLDATMIGNC